MARSGFSYAVNESADRERLVVLDNHPDGLQWEPGLHLVREPVVGPADCLNEVICVPDPKTEPLTPDGLLRLSGQATPSDNQAVIGTV
jgi:hypothetical protein